MLLCHIQLTGLVLFPAAILGAVFNWTAVVLLYKLPSFKHTFGYLSASQALADAIHSAVFMCYVCPMVVTDRNTKVVLFLVFVFTLGFSFTFYEVVCSLEYSQKTGFFFFTYTPLCNAIGWYADFFKYFTIIVLIFIIDISTISKVRIINNKPTARRDSQIPTARQDESPDNIVLCITQSASGILLILSVINSSARRIGYGIRTTNMKRLGTDPPCGVLDPKKASCSFFRAVPPPLTTGSGNDSQPEQDELVPHSNMELAHNSVRCEPHPLKSFFPVDSQHYMNLNGWLINTQRAKIEGRDRKRLNTYTVETVTDECCEAYYASVFNCATWPWKQVKRKLFALTRAP